MAYINQYIYIPCKFPYKFPIDPLKVPQEEWNKHMLCLDWVVGQLTTIGAGDLQPQDTRERVFTIFLLVLNLSFFAYVLGAISNLFMSADEHLVETRREASLASDPRGANPDLKKHGERASDYARKTLLNTGNY